MKSRWPVKNLAYHSQAEMLFVLLVCFCLGLLIVVAGDLKFSYRAALTAGFVGIGCIILLPNPRIALVIAWVLVHPLSIEKVFHFGTPLLPDFLLPQLVVSASDMILLMLAGYLCVESLIKQENVWQCPFALISLFALTLWTIVVFLFTNPSANSFLSVVHSIKMLLFSLVMVSSVRTKDEFKYVLISVAIAVGIQAIVVCTSSITGERYGFSSKLPKELLPFSGVEQGHFRATGTVGHVNQEASFLTFFALPLLGMMLSGGFIKRLTVWLIFSVTIIATITTFSRSAWISLTIGAICALIIAIKKRKLLFNHWIYGPPIMIVFFAMAIAFGKPMLDRLTRGDEGASSSRMRAIYLSWDLIKKYPIMGVGPWNYAKASIEEYPPSRLNKNTENQEVLQYGRLEVTQVFIDQQRITIPLPVHNKYLLVFTELGVIGLLIFLLFQVSTFNHIRRSLATRDKVLFWNAVGIMAAFFATQSYMNLDLFSDDKTMQILLFVPILGMITYNISKQDQYGLP